MTGPIIHPDSCRCCADLLHARFDRRRFLQIAGTAGLVAALPITAFAATGNYEAMVLSCIDPRFPEPIRAYTNQRDLTGKFSQFVIAGASIGVVAPKFKGWQKAFWDNLAASMQLHNIPKVIAINHRECGAAKIAYGEAKVANATVETQTHKAALAEFRKQVTRRHPKLAVETHLMALDGSVDTFT
jgi:carbonic anhydrase